MILTLVKFITRVYTKMSLEITIITKSFSLVLNLVRFITSVIKCQDNVLVQKFITVFETY